MSLLSPWPITIFNELSIDRRFFGALFLAILPSVWLMSSPRMEEVVFDPIDRRLARVLLEPNKMRIATTHQELAVQLGTAREVVSRHLKRFEQYGWVSLTRGAIDIADRKALARLVSMIEQ
jgi:CRP/FNR family transcriptional regulator, anaerobic regulatory protein